MSSSIPHHSMRPSWEAHRQEIEKLYMDEGRSREDVMDIMYTKHMFSATKNQWTAQFSKWGFRKNTTGDSWEEMDRYLSYHNIDLSQVKILLRGRPISDRRVKKEINRYRNTRSYCQVSHTLQHVPDQAPSIPQGFSLSSRATIQQIPVRAIELTPILMYTRITGFNLQLAVQPRSTKDLCTLLQSQWPGNGRSQRGSIDNLPIDVVNVPEMVVAIHVGQILPKIRSFLPILPHSHLPSTDDNPGHIDDSTPDNASSMTRHMNVAYMHLLLYVLSNNKIESLNLDGYPGVWLHLKSHINADDPLRLMRLLRAAKGKVLAWQLLRCAIEADDRLGVRELLRLKELNIALDDVLYSAEDIGGRVLLNAVEFAAYLGHHQALEGLISAGASANISGPEAQKRLQSDIGGPLYLAAVQISRSRGPARPALFQRVSQYLRRSGATVPPCFLRSWFGSKDLFDPLAEINECWDNEFACFLLDTREYYISWLREGAVHSLFEDWAAQKLSYDRRGRAVSERMWLLLQVIVTESEVDGTRADIYAPWGTNNLLDIAATMKDPGVYCYLRSCGYTSNREKQPEPQKLFTDYWFERVRHSKETYFYNEETTLKETAVSEMDLVPERGLISEDDTISVRHTISQGDPLSELDTSSARNSRSEDGTMSEDGRPAKDHDYLVSRDLHLLDDEETTISTEVIHHEICWHGRLLELIAQGDEANALQVIEGQNDPISEFSQLRGCDRSCSEDHRPTSQTHTPWHMKLILSSIHRRLDRVTKFILCLCSYKSEDAVIILKSALTHEDEYTVDYIIFGGLNPRDNWATASIYSTPEERREITEIVELEVLKAVVSSGAHFAGGFRCKVSPHAPTEVLQLIMDNSISISSSCFLSSLPTGCAASEFFSQSLSRPRPQPTPRQNALLLADVLLHATSAANIPLVEAICQNNVDVHTFEPLTEDRKQYVCLESTGRSNNNRLSSARSLYGFTGTLLGAVLLADPSHDSIIACLVLRRCCQKGELDRMAATSIPYSFDRHHSANGVYTPLLMAVWLSKLDLAQTLVIEFQADVNFPPDRGIKRTPLQLACEVGDLPIVEFLIEQGADINGPIAINGGGTALQLAAIGGFGGIMELLIKTGADVNAPGAKFYGRTALEGAAEHGRLDAVNILLGSGVKTDGEHRIHFDRAVAYAKEQGHIPLAEFMEDWEARSTETERVQ